MDEIEDGGPAFPVQEWNSDGTPATLQIGMTLRDYFAAKAMQEVFGQNWTHEDFSDEARRAYKMADAMLTERAK